MEKIFKNPIYMFILGALTFGGIGSVFAMSLLAKDISYTPKDSTWNVSNVADAIDDLKNQTNNKIIINRTIGSNNSSQSKQQDRFVLTTFIDKYKYIKITKAEKLKSSCSNVYFNDAWDQTSGKYEINKEYELNATNFPKNMLTTYITGSSGCFYQIIFEIYN